MSGRVAELAERQRVLQDRCEAQRQRIGREVRALEARFQPVDRAAGIARSTLLNPGVILAVVVGFFTLGRARGLQLIGRVMLLSSAAKRLMRFAKYL
jgi:hypothetical protein